MKKSPLCVAVLAAAILMAGCTPADTRTSPVGGVDAPSSTAAVSASAPAVPAAAQTASAGVGAIESTTAVDSKAIAAAGQGAKALHHPKAGSAERKAILDALRVPVGKELGQVVIFKIDYFAVENGWAFTYGQPLRANGKHIDYTKTPYAKALADGFFDDNFSALLHYRAGAWRVVTYNVGATDVSWIGWEKRYSAPRGLFPLH